MGVTVLMSCFITGVKFTMLSLKLKCFAFDPTTLHLMNLKRVRVYRGKQAWAGGGGYICITLTDVHNTYTHMAGLDTRQSW